MLQQETIKIRDKDLLHTFSDNGMRIKQVETGIVYDEAYDIIPCKYNYEETNQHIEPIENENE